MPVILGEDAGNDWLDTRNKRELRLGLLKPYEDSEMDAYSISRLITSREAETNTPKILEPQVYPELN